MLPALVTLVATTAPHLAWPVHLPKTTITACLQTRTQLLQKVTIFRRIPRQLIAQLPQLCRVHLPSQIQLLLQPNCLILLSLNVSGQPSLGLLGRLLMPPPRPEYPKSCSSPSCSRSGATIAPFSSVMRATSCCHLQGMHHFGYKVRLNGAI